MSRLHVIAFRVIELTEAVQTLTRKVHAMSQTLDTRLAALTAAVDRLDSVEESVVTFIKGVPQLIADAVAQATAAGATPAQLAALDALSARLTAETDNLAAAITNNTPASEA